MSDHFEIKGRVNLCDKEIIIIGPCQLKITVDYDDVDQKTVDNAVDRLLTILNKKWTDDDTRDCNTASKYRLR